MSKNTWVHSNQPIESIDELTQPFLLSRTKREDFLVGVELEQFLVDPKSLKQIPYEGSAGVENILRELTEKHRWNPVHEQEKIIALEKDGLNVTLEPGGAFEFVSYPVKELSILKSRIEEFNQSLKSVCNSLGVSILQYGRLPFNSLDDVKLVPKKRYDFMYPYMKTVGSRGQEMMKLTASVQVAIDYETEEDATRKLRLAAQATPFLLALSANSSFTEGSFNGSASDRAKIWQDTDNVRSGLPEFMFNHSACFSQYVQWALDVPIYFIERDSIKYPGKGITFRDFIQGKSPLPNNIESPAPTRADWEQHLSTLFPWVRFRHYIEIRAFDMGPLDLQLAAAAICKGLFYCTKALKELEDLIGKHSFEESNRLLSLAGEEGLSNPEINSLSKNIVLIAQSCLARHIPEEAAYLDAYLARTENWNLPKISDSEIESYLKTFIL